MRKFIVGVVLLLVSVLLLSNLSRITDATFDKFFSDDSSMNSGNSNNTGDNSENGSEETPGGEIPDDSGDSGGSSTGLMCSYKKTSVFFEENHIVDVSSVVKDGSYYYYKVHGSDFYVKYPEPLSSELIFFVSVYDAAYSISSSPVPEDDRCSKLFELDSLSPDFLNSEFYFHDGGTVSEEISFSPLICCTLNSAYDGFYYSFVEFEGVMKVIFTSEPIFSSYGYRIYQGSYLYDISYSASGSSQNFNISDIEEIGLKV